MQQFRRVWSLLSLILIMAFLLVACVPAAPAATGGSAAPAAAAEGPKGTLTIALTTDIAAIEVPYSPERQAANASWTLYDGLIFPEADGTYSPGLAESWEVSADGLTYTFKLQIGRASCRERVCYAV